LSGLKADFSGAFKKMADLKATPRATKYIATKWAAETVKDLKRSAADMQKSISPIHKKTGQLARATTMQVGPATGGFLLAVGTGLNTVDVKYAKIQDVGGMTHPTVTDRMRRWAWWAFYKEQGAQRSALKKMLPSMGAAQRRATARMGASKYLGIALTKKTRLDVKVPASKWFTSVIDQREPVLYRDMQPDHVLAVAKIMSGER
jgi:hypothetical protein